MRRLMVMLTETRERLVTRIIADDGLERSVAEQAVEETERFLRHVAATPGQHEPNKLADVGWHAFILHTRDYAEFCDQIAGRFIHHEPTGEADCTGRKCDNGDCRSA